MHFGADSNDRALDLRGYFTSVSNWKIGSANSGGNSR